MKQLLTAIIAIIGIASHAQRDIYDTNADGQVNVADIVVIYNNIINGGTETDKAVADVNGDGLINSADVVAIYCYIIAGNPLPTCNITSPNGADIISKTEYMEGAHIQITNSIGHLETDAGISIRGRGNTTWNVPDKKPYIFKLDKKKSILGMPADKTWVLLANYYDSTLIRNDIAFYMGQEFSTLPYTPRGTFVRLILNGTDKGIYQLCEKIKTATNRVNIGNDGIIVEVDYKGDDNDVTFRTTHLKLPFTIKDPDVEVGDSIYNYIVEYVSLAEKAIYKRNKTAEENDWRKYLDEDSFVEWYLVNEIAKNRDSRFYSSCFMNFKPGGKISMGPIWDFDIAFGGYPWQPAADEANDIEGFNINRARWYEKLLLDTVFVRKVNERFNHYYDNRKKILDRLETDAEMLSRHVAATEEERAAYLNQALKLKQWLEKRFEWLRENLTKL